MNKKIAVVTGAPGQDSYYLTKFLLDKGYEVWATHTYSSTPISLRFKNWDHLKDLNLAVLDLTDPSAINNFINTIKPDEVYNLAAKSHVHYSFEHPISSFEVNALGPLYILEAIKRYCPNTKFYQASTSELWGSNYSTKVVDHNMKKYIIDPNFIDYGGMSYNIVKYQDENTPFTPNSPYAIAKLAAHQSVRLYRESYDIWACAGILHNHTSPMRGEQFVEQKIAKWIARYWKYCNDNKCLPVAFEKEHILLEGGVHYPKLRLGNVDSVRDFSHAADMVEGMWLILNHSKPDDFVLASGQGHTIREVLKSAFGAINIYDYDNYWVVDPKFYRPREVDFLQGDATKAKTQLGWENKIDFNTIIEELVHVAIDSEVYANH
jgi:GDPmannose 4,6-dehydratase